MMHSRITIISIVLCVASACSPDTNKSDQIKTYLKNPTGDQTKFINRTVALMQCVDNRDHDNTHDPVSMPEPQDKFIKLIGSSKVFSDGQNTLVDLDLSTIPFGWESTSVGLAINFQVKNSVIDPHTLTSQKRILDANRIHSTVLFERNLEDKSKDEEVKFAYITYSNTKNDKRYTSTTMFTDPYGPMFSRCQGFLNGKMKP